MMRNTRHPQGFTLVELIIAVAIVAILAAIALPSYSSYVRRGNRAVAKAFMSELLQRQESYAVDHKLYASTLSNLGYTAGSFLRSDGNLAATSTGAIYQIALLEGSSGACTSAGPVTTGTQLVAVSATPVSPGPQAADSCAVLCVTSAGVKSVGGGATSTLDECWGK